LNLPSLIASALSLASVLTERADEPIQTRPDAITDEKMGESKTLTIAMISLCILFGIESIPKVIALAGQLASPR